MSHFFRLASLPACSLALAVGTAGTAALGQGAPVSSASPETARPPSSREISKYDFGLTGVTVRGGAAMASVNAPLSTVTAIITDYAHYQDNVPGFSRSRIVARGPEGTDVYLQAPLLHGAATLWGVVRFSPPISD